MMVTARETGELNDFGCVADVYDELVDWAPYGDWVDQLERSLRRWGLQNGHLLLDAACGTGLSALPWLERGYQVVGVDRSERMLQHAGRRVAEAGHRCEFVAGDLLSLDLTRRFDAAICMHSGLDYLLDDEQLARALRCLRGVLARGGLLAFDKCLDVPAFYRRSYTERRRLSNGKVRIHYRWDRDRKVMEQRCVVTRQQGGRRRLTEVVYHLKAVAPADLADMLAAAGFEPLEPVRIFRVYDPGFGIYRAI